MTLERIARRLESGFYRRLDAVRFDAELLARNAATYNGADHPVAADARLVANALLAMCNGE